MTPELLAEEREIHRAAAEATGKPAAVVEKIVTGKMEKFYEEHCLLEQPFVKDTAVSVQELVTQAAARIGENLVVRRFCRFVLGERS